MYTTEKVPNEGETLHGTAQMHLFVLSKMSAWQVQKGKGKWRGAYAA